MAVLMAIAATTTYAENSEVPADAIAVKVGQVMFVTFTPSGDSLTNPRVLHEPSATEPMVTLQLTQEGPTRTLLVTNGFARPLLYRAVARVRGHRRTFAPPVIAVKAGMQSIVTLAEPFEELLVFEFHLSASP